MRPISIDCARSEMVLARSIYNAEGKTLLKKGIALKPAYLKRINQLGISTVFIEDPRTDDIIIDDIIDAGTRQAALKLMGQILYNLENVKDVSTSRLPLAELQQIAGDIVDQLARQRVLMINNADMKNVENYTAAHCVNTAALSAIIGIKAGFTRKKLDQLCLGGLLHDVGKARIARAVLDKPGKLTKEEFDIIKTHSEQGYRILTSEVNRGVPAPAAIVALQHQEKVNGRGYPKGLTGEKIHEHARIAAVADVFDALSSDRVYKKRMLPNLALKVIRGAENTHFDERFVNIFVAHVATYPKGTLVELSNGDRGIVINSGSKNIHCPIVRVLGNREGQATAQPFDLDLSEFTNFSVVKILDDI